MDYTTISADAHIDIPWLPADLFVSNAPEEFKEHMPRVEETEQGRVWKETGIWYSSDAAHRVSQSSW